MSLSKYNPIDCVTLPDTGDVQAEGLILIVGPNSSGKTRLLRDIDSALLGKGERLIVAKGITSRKLGDFEPFIADLEASGSLRTVNEPDVRTILQPWSTQLGSTNAAGNIEKTSAANHFDQFSRLGPSTAFSSPVQFLHHFGLLLSTSLFLENRLTSVRTTPAFDFEETKPNCDMHALFLDKSAKSALSLELIETFGKATWVDTSRLTQICIRVSDSPEMPKPEDIGEPSEMKRYRLIDDEGDGMRSFAATCMAVLLSRRPVCLIDEPELCLHPPQAYRLGRFIAKHPPPKGSVTYVATHSSQVLRGVLESGAPVQIIRMSRKDGRFSAQRIQADTIATLFLRPATRSDTVLDGIFAESITVVEADSDRAVYQAAWGVAKDCAGRETYFAQVGGTGGLSGPLKLYRGLGIPVAIIADLDLVLDEKKFGEIIAALAPGTEADSLSKKCKTLRANLRTLSPPMSENEVRTELTALASQKLSWPDGDDEELAKKLRAVINGVSRFKRLKCGGVESIEDKGLKEQIRGVIRDCSKAGLFLVPVGELEYWCPTLMEGVSKSKKAEWADTASERIRESPEKAKDLIGFVESIATYLGH